MRIPRQGLYFSVLWAPDFSGLIGLDTGGRPRDPLRCRAERNPILKLSTRKHRLPTLSRTRGDDLLDSLRDALTRHPRRVMAGVGAVLLGTGVTAFGIAPLAPDASLLPVQQIVEEVSVPDLPDVGNLQATELTLYRSEVLRRDDTPQSLLQRLGVQDPQALTLLRSDTTARLLFEGRVGKLVTVETNDRQELLKLSARWLPDDGRQYQRLIVERQENGLHSRTEMVDLVVQHRVASGVIRHLPEHLLRDQREVFTRHLKMPEAKHVAPALGIANERELFHQRTDRRSLRIKKTDVAPEGRKARRHFKHIYTVT